MSNDSKHIIVHKPGAEGMFLIDRKTGSVATPSNELPEWATNYANAALASRTGWYEKRLGKLPEQLRSPHAIAVNDLDWLAVDEAGDMVEISADHEYRSGVLGTLLELDMSAEGFDALLQSHVHGALIDYTYQDQPNDEATFAEAAGQDFGAVTTEADQKAAQG